MTLYPSPYVAPMKNEPHVYQGTARELTTSSDPEKVIIHHPVGECVQGPLGCPFHAPSSHPLKDAPMLLRENGLIERICEHGVGHLDPDSVAYAEMIGVPQPFARPSGRACDGCCTVPAEPVAPEEMRAARRVLEQVENDLSNEETQ